MVLTYLSCSVEQMFVSAVFCAQIHSDSITVKVLGGFEGSISYRHLAGAAADPSTSRLKSKVK